MTHNIKTAMLFMLLLSVTIGCKKSILDEKALTFLSPDALRDKPAYESVLAALHNSSRHEHFGQDGRERYSMLLGTDLARIGDKDLNEWRDYSQEITPSGNRTVNYWWNLGYTDLLPKANIIISNVQQATSISQADKNAIEGEARFFRAYAYNMLVNIFGGVAIVDKFDVDPKTPFKRASKEEVYAFAQADLEFAAQHLPATAQPGRITKGAANHLLSEVYISLKQWDKAIEAATAVINNPQYKLMQQNERFGKYRDSAGTNIFWDLFREGNFNNPLNKEAIWVQQFEFGVPGGSSGAFGTPIGGGNYFRGWARWFSARDPDNKDAMTTGGAIPLAQLNRFGDKIGDSLNRGVGWIRPTNYWAYTVWTDPNDIRNSNSNVKRIWYYNNSASAYFRQPVTKHPFLDTMQHIYPNPTKFEGTNPGGFGSPNNQDFYKMRLAETFLLRGEAYLGKGDRTNAAADINAVRRRAGAADVAAANVTIDYILDERARELYGEEQRRRTLVRLGKLVERTRLYNNYLTGHPNGATHMGVGATIMAHHELYPIPQQVINASVGGGITQNPGY